MTKLNKREGIAVFVGIALLAYLFFSGPIMALFNSSAGDLTNNYPTMQNGFTSQEVVVGTGDEAKSGDLVAAHYVGRLENGQVFDSSVDRGVPIQFLLGTGQVIRGWDEGIVGMRVGGKRVLTISPEYGYGATAAGAIPPNSTLIFEVELVGVQKNGN